MIHNASIEKYRTPVGAVTCGSEMTIRLYETGESVSKAEIIMYSETFHREYEMKRKKDCMEEHLKITNEAGIVWYYFRIWEHGRCYFYGAKHGQTQGEGMIYDDTPQSFQITVYEKDFDTPRWMSKGIMYRFFQTVSVREIKRIWNVEKHTMRVWEEMCIFTMNGKNAQSLDHFLEKNFMIRVIILEEISKESYQN